jgi:ribonuclease HII
MSKNTQKPLCGIDEAGRGPLAGSLVIVGVILDLPIEGLDDSKKLSEKRREALYPTLLDQTRHHIVSFASVQVDDLGISECLRQGLRSIQAHFGEGVEYLYDGNTTFGVDNLSTLVKADTKVPEVAAASILAKVTRDHDIIAAAVQYPQYGFDKHKGYGTRAHIEAIVTHGRCPIHRTTFRIKQIDDLALF